MVDASSGAATPFEIGYNTMVFSTNAQVSAITGVGTPNSNAGLHSISNGVGTVHDNYINPAHPSGGFAPSVGYPGSSYAGLSTYSNNVNMVDGTLFTNTP